MRNWRQIGAGDMVLHHRVIWIKALCDVMAGRERQGGVGRQHPACSEILVHAKIEPRKKKKTKKKKKTRRRSKKCLLREIKDLKGERIHLRFCELAINLVVRFLFFSFFSFCIAFFLISPFPFFLPTKILLPIIANLSDL